MSITTYVISNCRKRIGGGNGLKNERIRSGQNKTFRLNDNLFDDNYTTEDYLQQCKNYYELKFDSFELTKFSTIKKKNVYSKEKKKVIRDANIKLGKKYNLSFEELRDVSFKIFKIGKKYKCEESFYKFTKGMYYTVTNSTNSWIFFEGDIGVDSTHTLVKFDLMSKEERRQSIIDKILL